MVGAMVWVPITATTTHALISNLFILFSPAPRAYYEALLQAPTNQLLHGLFNLFAVHPLSLHKAGLLSMKDDEVAASVNGIRDHFIGSRDTRNNELHAVINRNVKGAAIEVNIGGVRFLRRKNGVHTIWAFKKRDIRKLADHMGWEVRSEHSFPTLKDDEISASTPSIKELYVGESGSMTKALQKKIATVSKPGIPIATIGSIKFFKRTYAPHEVWAFKRTDTDRVAKLMGWQTKKTLRKTPILSKTDISVADKALLQNFVGAGGAHSKTIRGIIADAAKPGANKVLIGGVVFSKKMSGRHAVWTFDEKDIVKVSKITGWELRKHRNMPELASNEIGISEASLAAYFSGNRYIQTKTLNSALSNLPVDDNWIVTLSGIRFFKRTHGPKVVWAFLRQDLKKVGELMKWELKRDAESTIEDLGLEDAISLLGGDALRLQQYLQLFNPEMLPAEMNRVIGKAMAMQNVHGGFDTDDTENPYKGFRVGLPNPEVKVTGINRDNETDAHSVLVQGQCEPGTDYVQVFGSYSRKVKVRHDGSFEARIPLPRTGEDNTLAVMGVNAEEKLVSPPYQLVIKQTSEKSDPGIAFLQLVGMKEELLAQLRKNPAKYYFLLQSIEQTMLRYFTQSEAEGFKILARRIKNEKSSVLRNILQVVEKEFIRIGQMPPGVKQEQRLYFFQKYTIYKAGQMLEREDPVTGEKSSGVIIANEQGLGKTVTAIVLINGQNALVITPNTVVSTWAEQEEKFITKPKMDILRGSYREREEALATSAYRQVVTNVEFMQNMTGERRDALEPFSETLVVDEADYLGQKSSLQSKGTWSLKATKRILLTATPFKKHSQIARLLGFLFPNDQRFSDAKAFAKAFPGNDQEILSTLFFLMRRHMIRIRKQDVFQEYDPAIPLERQHDRLPRKEEVAPETMGRFELTIEQCESIKLLLTNYKAWCEKQNALIKAGKITRSVEDQHYYRAKEGYFPKLQALRQIMNDPAYIGVSMPSPKHRKMEQIVKKEITEGHKIAIYAKYRAQVEKYTSGFAKQGALAYYGALPRDNRGYKIDDQKQREYFKVDEFGKYILNHGRPIRVPKGEGQPMLALDYQRISFQENPEKMVLAATYETGSVGVTLTAADVMVRDDLAPTYRDEFQADDRIHRIDNSRKKYAVRYYRMQAVYPKAWLDSLPRDVYEKYFSMGTYDQVHGDNLKHQKYIFHKIMDGVGDESELKAISEKFLKNRMPFLFEGEGTEDSEAEITELESQDNGPEDAREEPAGKVKPGTAKDLGSFILLIGAISAVHPIAALLFAVVGFTALYHDFFGTAQWIFRSWDRMKTNWVTRMHQPILVQIFATSA